MIASLLGCTNVILNRVAEKNHVEVQALSLAAEASFDRRGVMLEEEVAVPFPEIRLTIDAGDRLAGTAPQIGSRQVLPGLEGHPSVRNQIGGDLERHARVMFDLDGAASMANKAPHSRRGKGLFCRAVAEA